MAERLPSNGHAPPPGETIHLPGPSYLPVVVAFGTTLVVVGVVVSLVLVALGALVLAFSLARWIGDTRRDVSELPLEH